MILITVLFIGLISLFLYAYLVEPFQLEIKEVVHNDLGVKIVQFSDLHFGKSFNESQLLKVIEAINAVEADIVLFCGDLFSDAYCGDIDSLISLLSNITCVNKYAIMGNHDYKYFAYHNFEKIMALANFKILRNGQATINIVDKVINLVGVDDYILGEIDYINTKASAELISDYSILLLHEPDVASLFESYGFNLILSGHSHGGQVLLPFNIRGKTKLGVKYYNGLYALSNNTNLYVSSGLGTSGFRLRFRVKPSITVHHI